jgi:hypothetical protein
MLLVFAASNKIQYIKRCMEGFEYGTIKDEAIKM